MTPRRMAAAITLTAAAGWLLLVDDNPPARPPHPTPPAPLEAETPPPPTSGPPLVVETSSPTSATTTDPDRLEELSTPPAAKTVAYGTPYPAPSAELLAELRQCEATGAYAAVSPNGIYRGAYQFDRRTWDDLHRRHGLDYLVGVDPDLVYPTEQDRAAILLWLERGPKPWPTCGPRALARYPQG